MRPFISHLPSRRRRRWCSTVLIASAWTIACSSAGAVDPSGFFNTKMDAISLAVQSGEWESYLTGYAWHLPWGYAPATRARLNEKTWGGGFGRTAEDADGHRHSVFAMAFVDSHRATQFNVGYSCQRYWSPGAQLNFGLGYMAFIFSREDVAHHLPLPAALPVASIRYRRYELMGLFVPKISKDIKGDVLFFFLRVPLGGTPVSERQRKW